jgi:hypothetical protein
VNKKLEIKRRKEEEEKEGHETQNEKRREQLPCRCEAQRKSKTIPGAQTNGKTMH